MVIIVGIIATIAIPSLRTSVSGARETKIRNALNQVDAAKIQYFLDTKDPGVPPLNTLATYITNEGAVVGGQEIFYTVQAWKARVSQSVPTATGALFGGIPGNMLIQPNAKDVPASLLLTP